MHALAGLALALLAQAPARDARARDIVERITFPDAGAVKQWTDQGPEYRTFLDILLKKENWVVAVRELEERLGPFADTWTIEVALDDWKSRLAATSNRSGARGRIRFNMRTLGGYERTLIALRKQAEDLKREGKRMRWKVPPVKYERLIHHELTHILQGDCESPGWFHEGLATWAAADMLYVISFAHARRPVQSIEVDLSADPDDEYGRGMMFFSWLESLKGRDGVRRLYQTSVVEGTPWKKALEDVTGLKWSGIIETERAWSAAFCAKHAPDD